MKRILCTVIAAVCAGFAANAQAAVSFSNIQITGTLNSLPPPAQPATFTTGTNTIDFIFTDAQVGDAFDPLRMGNLMIMYEASSSVGLTQDLLVMSLLGALTGSGSIFFNETVQDLNQPGNPVIAMYTTTLDSNDDLPHAATINFANVSTHVLVKKTIVLEANNTAAFDFSNVSLIEQTFREIPVPEPTSALMLLLGGLGLIRRRNLA